MLAEQVEGDDVTDHGIDEIKNCIRCFEPIHAKAKVCPHCLRWQSKWAMEYGSPHALAYSLGALVVVIAVAGGFVWWAEGQDEAPPSFVDALSVDATEIVAVEDPDGPYVALMLTVTNSSDHPWTRVRLQVDFANSAGRVVDSWVDQNYDVYVPANGEIRFRILRSAIRPFSEYSSASVSVLSANRGGT
jgi:hypothetical protein